MDKEIVQITAAHCFIIKSSFLFETISPLSMALKAYCEIYSIIKLCVEHQ